MQTIKSILVTGTLFLSLCVSAQNMINEKDNEFDRKYTPPQGSLFNDLGSKNNASSRNSEVEIKNAIKFCPTAVFRQKALFYYQRELYRGLSLNLGIGKAFGRDLIQQVAFSLFEPESRNGSLSAAEIANSSTYTGSSVFLSAGLRVYYSGKSFDGGYVEFNYGHERLDYDLDATVNGDEIRGARNCYFKMNALSFGFGHTFTSGQKNNVTHDLFFNFGLKLFKVTKFDQYTGPNAYGSTIEYYIKTSQEIDARLVPTFNMGYVFGFGF